MVSVLSRPAEPVITSSAAKLLINNRWVSSESGKTFPTIKQSDVGRELGEYGLQEYPEVKTVTVKL